MFIGRRDDGTIYGMWTVQQWKDQEELPAADPAVLAFMVPSQNVQIAAKREAALDALQKEQLLKRAGDADAPQAIKDYAAALAAQPASIDAVKPG